MLDILPVCDVTTTGCDSWQSRRSADSTAIIIIIIIIIIITIIYYARRQHNITSPLQKTVEKHKKLKTKIYNNKANEIVVHASVHNTFLK